MHHSCGIPLTQAVWWTQQSLWRIDRTERTKKMLENICKWHASSSCRSRIEPNFHSFKFNWKIYVIFLSGFFLISFDFICSINSTIQRNYVGDMDSFPRNFWFMNYDIQRSNVHWSMMAQFLPKIIPFQWQRIDALSFVDIFELQIGWKYDQANGKFLILMIETVDTVL